MENIKNLSPRELVELVHTWYEANKNERAIILMAGKDEGENLANTHLVAGKGTYLLMMLLELMEENSELVMEAMRLDIAKKLRQFVKDVDQQEAEQVKSSK